MNLKNNQIKMGELLKNQEAKIIIQSEFPEFNKPMFIALSRGMTLEKVLNLARGKVAGERIDRVLVALDRAIEQHGVGKSVKSRVRQDRRKKHLSRSRRYEGI